jgi:CheY-like chemotaxis protein
MPEKCLFLVDLNMPIMNGWQFVEEAFKTIPENGPDVKLYIMSSSISDQDISKAKNNPKITGYIVKPVMKHKLKEVLFGEPKDFVLL